MNEEANRAIVEGFLEAIPQLQNNPEAFDAFISENVVLHVTGLPEIQGLEALRETFQMWLSAFPDVEIRTEFVIVDGDKVGYTNYWRATHKGEFLGIPPTDKRVTAMDVHIDRIADGKIVERWAGVEATTLGMLEQLGDIPSSD